MDGDDQLRCIARDCGASHRACFLKLQRQGRRTLFAGSVLEHEP